MSSTTRMTRIKAMALTPMVLLCAVWWAVGPSVASDESRSQLPDLPAAIDAPASVQRVVDPLVAGSVSEATAVPAVDVALDIPTVALAAYRRAERLLGEVDAECHLSWTVVAAIGRVESDHGRFGGSSLGPDGVASPAILGVALDGSGDTVRILDTDGGRLDRDPVFDRAVGPMQFIPSTWESVRVDADADGTKDPQDIDDAAAAAGVYLCSGTGDLSTEESLAAALHSYNHSDEYVRTVLSIARSYASSAPLDGPQPVTMVLDDGPAAVAGHPATTRHSTPARPVAPTAPKPAPTEGTPVAGGPVTPPTDPTPPVDVDPVDVDEPAPTGEVPTDEPTTVPEDDELDEPCSEEPLDPTTSVDEARPCDDEEPSPLP